MYSCLFYFLFVRSISLGASWQMFFLFMHAYFLWEQIEQKRHSEKFVLCLQTDHFWSCIYPNGISSCFIWKKRKSGKSSLFLFVLKWFPFPSWTGGRVFHYHYYYSFHFLRVHSTLSVSFWKEDDWGFVKSELQSCPFSGVVWENEKPSFWLQG